MNRRESNRIWRQYQQYHRTQETLWAPRIAYALRLQVSAFVKVARSRGLDYAMANMGNIVPELPVRKVLIRLYAAVLPRYANITAKRLQDEYGPELNQKSFGTPNAFWLRLVQLFMTTEGATKVVDITETTREFIRRRVNEGLANADDVEAIMTRLLSDPINAMRGRRIARTEVGNAANKGGQAAAKRSGLRLNKVWISARDNRTRRVPRDKYDHLSADGQTVPLDEPFNISGELMMHPCAPGASAGNVVNCRCTSAHEAVRDGAGRLIRTPISTAIGG